MQIYNGDTVGETYVHLPLLRAGFSLLIHKDCGHTHTTSNTHARDENSMAILLGNVQPCGNLTCTSYETDEHSKHIAL